MKISFNWNKKDKSTPFGILIEECLSEEEAKKLKNIDFEKLIDVDRDERLDMLSQLIEGDKIAWLNSRIEKDIILPWKQKGMINWANEDKDIEPKWRKEIIRKISELEEPLNKKEEEAFLEELANLKLGAGVTLEEEQMITSLCKKVEEAKKIVENGGDSKIYEIACKNVDDYVAMLEKS